MLQLISCLQLVRLVASLAGSFLQKMIAVNHMQAARLLVQKQRGICVVSLE